MRPHPAGDDTAKSCSQGSDDLRGANRIIFAEEFLFLPAYGLVWGLLGFHGYAAVIAAMLMADGAAASFGWARLVRRGFLRGAAPPSFELGRRVAAYGIRAQVGGVMSQLNLRLDFVILSILTGPAVLGVYAVASKFAELVKVLGLALTYVFYPKFARGGRLNAVADVQRLIPKAGAITGCVRRRTLGQRRLRDSRALRIALQFGSYPHEDHPAGSPARGGGRSHHRVLVGSARPGLTSWAMGLGLIATVALDLVLILRLEQPVPRSPLPFVPVNRACADRLFWWSSIQQPEVTEGAVARNGGVQVTTSGAPASRR